VSDDRLTVSETRELLTESLSRAQDCATDLVRELSERDETIARLTAELVAARAALRDAAHIVEGVRAAARGVGVDFSRRMMPNELAALLRWRAGDHATVVEAAR